jgi:hypothetical protein
VTAPTEVKVAVAIVGLGALVFVAVALLWDSTSLRFPIGTGILAVAVCVGLLVRLRFARMITMVVVTLFAVVHLVIALSDTAPWWVRAVSGVLTAAYIYAAVVVNTEPARHYLETSK